MASSRRAVPAAQVWLAPGRIARRKLLAILAIGAAVAVIPGGLETSASEAVNGRRCNLPTGVLAVTDLPTGRSVIDCAAVGRMVSLDGAGLTIPEPGMGVSVEGVSANGSLQHFQLEVSADGIITYPEPAVDANDPMSETPGIRTDAAACFDAAHSIYGYAERDSYAWRIGDGGMPGALSQSAAQLAFLDAINNITDSYNDCGLKDEVSAIQRYSGTTSYEADFASGSLTCTARDRVSTWDAGDLNANSVAGACVWYVTVNGSPADVVEADVRYNTVDFDFTNDPSSRTCRNKYDIRAVGTHEAGHVFGLGHVAGGHSNLTMYTHSFICNAKARTLGRGDVLGLQRKY